MTADSNNNTFQHAAVVVFSVACAYVLKRFGVVDEKQAGKTISTIVIYLTMPATTFKVIASIETFQVEYLYMSAICLVYTLLVITPFNVYVCRSVRSRDAALRTSLLQGWGIGQFAYPLVETMWGEQALAYVVFFDLGNAVPCFIISYACQIYFREHADTDRRSNDAESIDMEGSLLSFESSFLDDDLYARGRRSNVAVKIFSRLIRFPPILAFLLGVIVCLSAQTLPPFVVEGLSVFSDANGFMVYTLLGLYLNFDLRRHWPVLRRLVVDVVLPRLVFGTAAGVACYFAAQLAR